MANGKILQAIVEIAGSVSPSLEKAVKATGDKLGKINIKAAAVGAAAAAGAVAIGKAAVDAGKYLLDLGSQFDEVADSIRIGTGATGDALDALMNDFDAVYSSVPTTMDDASKAVADYNTRLGLTGDELQGVSTQAIQVADMLGEDLGGVIESSSKAFQQWNIDAKDMGGAMDYVFKASQSTGVGFSELMTTVQSFGPQLQEMGYSFEEATALVGQLEKAGVNTEEVLGAMKKSTAALAKEGIGASEGMEMYAKSIMNAKDMTKATEIATEVFGTRAASTMAAAIRDGSVSVDELTKSLSENGETIGGCAEDTYDYAEKMQMFKQKAQVALEPLGATLFDAMNDLMPIVEDLLSKLLPVIQDISDTVGPMISEIFAEIGPMISELIPPIMSVVQAVVGKLLPPLNRIIISILPVIIRLAELLTPIIEIIIDVISSVLVALEPVIVTLMEIIGKILPVITDLISQLAPIITQIIEAILPILLDFLNQILPIVMEIVDAVLPIIIDLIKQLMPIITTLIQKLLPVIQKILSAILPIVIKIIEMVLPILLEILNAIAPILSTLINLIGPILDMIFQIITPLLDLIFSVITPLMSLLMELISNILEPLSPIIQFLATMFSEVLGGAMSSLQPIIDTIMQIFGGLMDFITGIFSGNWEQAWNGIVDMFKGIFNLIPTFVESVINGAIDLINGILKGINKIAGKVGWEIELIPHVTLPRFAAGGFTNGVSIAGEAGTEAVISFDPAYRDENIGYWMQSGKMLGVLDEASANASGNSGDGSLTAQAGKLMTLDNFSLGQMTESTVIYYDFSGLTWAPQVEAGSDTDKNDILVALKKQASEFFDWLDEWIKQKEVGSYDRVGVY